MTGSPAPCDHQGRSQLPEIDPLLADDVDKHEVRLELVQRGCFLVFLRAMVSHRTYCLLYGSQNRPVCIVPVNLK